MAMESSAQLPPEIESNSMADETPYEDPTDNLLRNHIHWNQKNIVELSKQFLPFVTEDYYTSNRVESILNNPLDLIFEMLTNWLLIKPLRYFEHPSAEKEDRELSLPAAEELYTKTLTQYLQKHKTLHEQLRKLVRETDVLSLKLAQKVKAKFPSAELTVIPKKNWEARLEVSEMAGKRLEKLPGSSDHMPRVFISKNVVAFNYEPQIGETLAAQVFISRGYTWNNLLNMSEFNLDKDFEKGLPIFEIDPLVYSPDTFKRFCHHYGLNTAAADYLFQVTATTEKLYRKKIEKACERYQKRDLTDVQLNFKLSQYSSLGRSLAYRAGRIFAALETN